MIEAGGALPKLKVLFVAAQAAPYAMRGSRGLAQVAGKVPAALARLGVETSLVLPYYHSTQELVEKQGLQTRPITAFDVSIGALTGHVDVLGAVSTTTPEFPIYFLENAERRGDGQVYGYSDDAERFAFFSAAALILQRQLGAAPDIIDCQDWHFAFLTSYLQTLRDAERPRFEYSDKLFDRTKTVLTVHDFFYTGETLTSVYGRAGLGFDVLPAHAEFYGRFNPLKMGLYRADRTVTRSKEYLEQVMRGQYGPKGFDAVVAERFKQGTISGLFSGDTVWRPELEFSEEVATGWAKALLGIYRTLHDLPFAGMELATKSEPPAPYLLELPIESLERVNPQAQALYRELRPADQSVVDAAIRRGEINRFAAVTSAPELENVLALLRIAPTADLENIFREEGLDLFLEPFFARDLDRLMSVPTSLKSYRELLKGRPELDPKTKTSLIEAFKLYEETDRSTLLDHTLNVFRSIKRMAEALTLSEQELAARLGERGEQIFDEPLSLGTSEFRQFNEVLSQLTASDNRSLFRSFVVGLLFHDLGKLINHSAHAIEGWELLAKVTGLSGVLQPAEIEFARLIIKHHSLFGDIFGLREQDPQDIVEFFQIQNLPDRKVRDYLLKSLYLLGIADIDAIGRRGRLSLRKMAEIRKAYETIIFAQGLDHLQARLDELGFSQGQEGASRWNRWVVRERDQKPTRTFDSLAAAAELERYCARQIEADVSRLSLRFNLKDRTDRKSYGREIRRRIKEKELSLKKQLGQIEDIRKIDGLTKKLDHDRLRGWGISAEPAVLRSRLLIWLAELSREYPNFKNVNFEFSIKSPKKLDQEMAGLARLLDNFDLPAITAGLRLEFDPTNSIIEISVKP